jgi:nucleotide-binding universal stress UspA family protein
MFKKVQAAVDGLPRSRDAAALAQTLAEAGDADLLLVGAYQDPLLPLPLVVSRDAHPGRDAQLALATARTHWARRGHTETVPDFSPARAIRRMARDRGADLLVLGSGRQVRYGRAGAGRTGRQVLHGASCAVAFAAVGLHESDDRLRRVVVGVDGGPEAHVALRAAADLGRCAGATVTAVAVVDDRLDVHGWPPELFAELIDWEEVVELRRRRLTTHLEKLVAATDPPVRREVRTGDPATELYDVAAGADLLLIGSRGWGLLDRIAIGSTAEALAHDAPCSLLVLPRISTRPKREARTAARGASQPA